MGSEYGRIIVLAPQAVTTSLAVSVEQTPATPQCSVATYGQDT